MNNKYYGCGILMFFFLSTSFVKQSDQYFIEWNKGYKLTWDDFKGKLDTNNPHEAISSVGIEFKEMVWNKKNAYGKVIAIFYPAQSWSKSKDRNAILEHEQGHFDITEIYARRLRKKLNNKRFKKNTVSKDLEIFYNQIEQEKNDYQNLYDKETEHHKNAEKQTEWNEKILMELQELEKFSNPEIVIKL